MGRLEMINDMIKVVKGSLGNDAMINTVDTIDEMQRNINTDKLTNSETLAFNELQSVLWSYYSGK